MMDGEDTVDNDMLDSVGILVRFRKCSLIDDSPGIEHDDVGLFTGG